MRLMNRCLYAHCMSGVVRFMVTFWAQTRDNCRCFSREVSRNKNREIRITTGAGGKGINKLEMGGKGR